MIGYDIESSESDVTGFVTTVIQWTDSHVQRKRWDDEEIDKKFVRRSAYEVLDEGHTCYRGPCLDLTLIALLALKEEGLETNLVVEEVQDPNFPDFTRLHFASEFSYNGGKYFLDFSTHNIVFFGCGDYFNARDEVSTVDVMRINGKLLDFNKPLHQNMGLDSPESVEEVFSNFSFSKTIEMLKRNNGEKTYLGYLMTLKNEGKLYLTQAKRN